MELPSWTIYALCDPRIEDPIKRVRYVGKTVNPRQRLKHHIVTAGKHKSHKSNWVKSLLDSGVRPTMEIVEQGTGPWEAAEVSWIAHYRALGSDLTNGDHGGKGGHHATFETRLKQSIAHRGRKGTGRKKGFKMNPETIVKILATKRSKKFGDQLKLCLRRKGGRPRGLAVSRPGDGRGVTQLPNGCWRARAYRGKTRYQLGVFDTREEATQVRDRFLSEPEFAREWLSAQPTRPTRRNPHKVRPNSTGFRGVHIVEHGITARIMKDKKSIHLGTFPTVEAAARAYDAKAKELFGRSAILNFREVSP